MQAVFFLIDVSIHALINQTFIIHYVSSNILVYEELQRWLSYGHSSF